MKSFRKIGLALYTLTILVIIYHLLPSSLFQNQTNQVPPRLSKVINILHFLCFTLSLISTVIGFQKRKENDFNLKDKIQLILSSILCIGSILLPITFFVIIITMGTGPMN
jgi:magnesium-transporting ATPase (P-type)